MPTELPSIGETDWGRLLAQEFMKDYWVSLGRFLEQERGSVVVHPPDANVFRALQLTSCAHTRVVIVGQDPYHGAGQADGLSFSVPRGVPKPPSLRTILRELQADVGVPIPNHGSLDPWAAEGVLLLNATLTVTEGRPGSHRGRGWERFTDAVIRTVTRERDPVFLLWGKEAQRKMRAITDEGGSLHKIIRSSHPSPIAASRPCLDSPPFIGSRPFSRANEILRSSGGDQIDWDLCSV